MLTAMVRGDLDDSLATTLYFRNLEQSEKVGVSFLLGEAFAHWFAQHHMQVPILVPVTGLPGCQWASASTTLALKNGAQLPAEKSRPDFIGIRRHERHVFESKGRIRHPSTQTIAKALGQVSKIATVNGAIPTTRCVTAFMFKASGSSGMVVDPPAHPASHLGTRICLRVSHNLPSDNPVQLRAVWSKTIPKTNHMAADSSLSHCHTKGFN
jgi:hypothetical protein